MASKAMSSPEAYQAFKTKVCDSLLLLQFLNEEGKNDVWKFWKTISSAVKIAVGGKGDVSPISKPSGVLQWHHKVSDCKHSQNSDQNTATVHHPFKVSGSNNEKYQVLNADNDGTTAKCEISVPEQGNDSREVTEKQDVLDDSIQSMPTSSASLSGQNKPSSNKKCLQSQGLSAVDAKELSPGKRNTVVWPRSRPTTRSIAKNQGLLRDQLMDDFHKAKMVTGTDPNVLEKQQLQSKPNLIDFHSTDSNDNRDDYGIAILPIEIYGMMQVVDKKQLKENGSIPCHSEQVHEQFGSINSNDSFDQRSSICDKVSLNSDLQNHKSQETINLRTSDQSVIHEGTSTQANINDNTNNLVTPTQIMQIKIEEPVMDHDSPQIRLEMDPNTQKLHIEDRLSNRSTSDIETIISALEAELKKNGSDVGSISITAGQEITAGVVSQSCNQAIQLISGQEIVEIENDEDVVWNSERNLQTLGRQSMNGMNEGTIEECAVTPQIDAEYDVVEYEVLADKEKTSNNRSRKKKSKNLCQQSDELDRTCPMCHRVLLYASSMAAHMRIHTGDRPYSCGQCDRKFTTKANRDRHEATHVGLKPFKCTECDKSFTEKRSLKIHMRSHTGERPFVCTICDRGFAQKCTLLVHMDKHMNKKGHLCDLCGKAFRQKSQLDIHVKRHNRQANFPCTQCPVKCYTRGDLMRHMIKHTGARPYHCSLCSRTFTRKQYVMDHENTHYDRKPYKCSFCSECFHDMGSCHRHTRKHKQEEEEDSRLKSKNTKPLLSTEDFNIILKGSQTGQILTLEDGTKALVNVVESEADGSVVYHISCVENDYGVEKFESESSLLKPEVKRILSNSAETPSVSNVL